ncbi:MAG: Coenzyme F420 hydrogenase/dehydrogenase, beta subunit C-terminal domain [Pseudomonadota bacterium]
MAGYFKANLVENSLLKTLRAFLKTMLDMDDIRSILVPCRLPMKPRIMPMLVSDASYLANADPIAPSFPLNSARIVSRLTRKTAGGVLAVVLRPCEMRAFVELVKLNQGHPDDLILVGLDCIGAFSNRDYAGIADRQDSDFSENYCWNILSGKDTKTNEMDQTPACRTCMQPVPDQADIRIQLFGSRLEDGLCIQAGSEKGEQRLSRMQLTPSEKPPQRDSAVEQVIRFRQGNCENMIAEVEQKTDSMEKLGRYLADCVNCYNCRVACPVCYCKECVFATDVFCHEPYQYLRWADRKGAIKMPTDTVFYHLTRLSHMSTACVGCGQCSNACPNDIPVMELFKSVSLRTQKVFDYQAGRDVHEKPPLTSFRENEYEDIVG